jgi:hypothetical protein
MHELPVVPLCRRRANEWSRRGPFYAILKRMPAHAEFFERLVKLRPRYLALFGVPAADSFKLSART